MNLAPRLARIGVLAASVVVACSVGMVTLHFRRGNAYPAVIAQGVAFGCLNALFAVGLVLIYRATRVINFSHAGFGSVSAVLLYELVVQREWSWWLAAPTALAAGIALGALTELLFVRRFMRAPRLVLTVVTLGLSQALAALAAAVPRLLGDPALDSANQDGRTAIAFVGGPVRTPFSGYRRSWFPVVFTGDHIALGVATVIALGALIAFFSLTRAGVAVRGAAENDDRAALLGINTGSLSTLVWLIAGGLSALAAILQTGVTGYQPSFGAVGSGLLVPALAAAVIGAMEDLPITVVAAINISVLQQVVAFSFEKSAYVDAAILATILVALFARRSRLARTDEAASSTWAAAEEVRPVPIELARLAVVKRAGARFLGAAVLITAALPFVLSPSQTNLASLFMLYGIVVVSLVVLTGWGGQVSLGQFALVGVGSLVGGSLMDKAGVPFLPALLLGSLAGAGVAVILGLTALRVRGLYLAVTTLAFAVAFQTVGLNRGIVGFIPNRVNRPAFLGIKTEDERAFYYLALVALGLAWWAAAGLRRSRTGRVLIAARDNERGVQAMGVNLIRTRLATFALSGFLAAFAGVFYACHQHSVVGSSFGADQSVQIFLTAIIGGLGSVQGALLGALYFAITGLVVKGALGQLLASSGGVLVVLLFFPGGLGSLAYQARDAVLRRIAIRRRIYVPSLLADRFNADGQLDRVPLAERDDAATAVPSTYRLPSRIGVAGASQSGRRWSYE